MTARLRDDRGSAVVEFVTIGVLLLVPLIYLVVTMGRVQAASFAVEGAARDAARVFTTAGDEDAGRARAVASTRWALLDQGFSAGADVTATVSVDVVLPGVPAGIAAVVPTVVPVSATHVQVVEQFGAAKS